MKEKTQEYENLLTIMKNSNSSLEEQNKLKSVELIKIQKEKKTLEKDINAL